MEVHKSHKIRLYPNKAQETFFKKSCGVARYSYNWALTKWQEIYESGGNPSAYTLIKLQNSIKKEQMPFFSEVGKCAPQYAIHNLQRGFNQFFKKNCKYPKYKKKNSTKDSFVAVENDKDFYQEDYKIRIPRLGYVKCAENIRFKGKIYSATIKRAGDKWYAVINMKVLTEANLNNSENQAIIGVDVGIKTMITLSDGITFTNPNPLRRNLKRIRRIQRKLSKKKAGSNNYEKQRDKFSKKSSYIVNRRTHAIHNATKFIINNYKTIVIENLDIQALMKKSNMAFLLNDVSFGEIFRQIKYKSDWNGNELIEADRFFPSSKTCSNCGCKKNHLKLDTRVFKCDNCNAVIERDLNAAINLAKYGSTHKLGGSYAFGVEQESEEILISLTMNKEMDKQCHRLEHDAGTYINHVKLTL